jgi:hypothetical protein
VTIDLRPPIVIEETMVKTLRVQPVQRLIAEFVSPNVCDVHERKGGPGQDF